MSKTEHKMKIDLFQTGLNYEGNPHLYVCESGGADHMVNQGWKHLSTVEVTFEYDPYDPKLAEINKLEKEIEALNLKFGEEVKARRDRIANLLALPAPKSQAFDDIPF